jgi:hypothetical protein
MDDEIANWIFALDVGIPDWGENESNKGNFVAILEKLNFA